MPVCELTSQSNFAFVEFQKPSFWGSSGQPLVGLLEAAFSLAQSSPARYTFVREFGSLFPFALDRLDAWPGLYSHVPDTLL